MGVENSLRRTELGILRVRLVKKRERSGINLNVKLRIQGKSFEGYG